MKPGRKSTARKAAIKITSARTKADYYRRQVDECCAKADSAGDPQSLSSWLVLAAAWNGLAADADRWRSAAGVKPKKETGQRATH